jgi:hypothetical protein
LCLSQINDPCQQQGGSIVMLLSLNFPFFELLF